jgi:hypothetical protein
MSAAAWGKKKAIAPHVLKQNQAIAQLTHCDRSILSCLGQGRDRPSSIVFMPELRNP